MGKQHKRILLLLNFYYPRLHRGIMDYARTHQWDIETPYPRYLEESARNWRGDAIITDMDYYLPQLRKRGVRIAVPAETLAEKADCTVCSDEEKIGSIAADYFLHKGFSHFAFCSGTARGKAFQEKLRRHGYSAIPIAGTYPYMTEKRLRNRMELLKKLPRPCAIFCENDRESGHVVNLALDAGLRVTRDCAFRKISPSSESGTTISSATPPQSHFPAWKPDSMNADCVLPKLWTASFRGRTPGPS